MFLTLTDQCSYLHNYCYGPSEGRALYVKSNMAVAETCAAALPACSTEL
jgi:hypothetical protein